MSLQNKIIKSAQRVWRRMFRLMPKKIRRGIAEECVCAEVVAEAKDSLLFLLHMDSVIYRLTGYKSIEYNGGSHCKHSLTKYHDFFVDRIKPGESVIDIGCGRGDVDYEIVTKSGGTVVGIDKNTENLSIAKEKYNHPKLEFIESDGIGFIPSRQFDTVILSNVLEHIEKRKLFLKQVIKQIEPARILIRVPMFNRDWRIALKKELGMHYFLDDSHCTEYTQETFEDEMTAAGLSISHIEIRWGEIWAEVVPTQN